MMFLIAKTLQKAPLVGIDSTYATRSNATIHVHKTKCTYNKDVTIYMDAFNEVSKIYFGKSYQGFITKSRHCKPLPGGTRCLFNHDNKSSDAILYYGGYTILKFQRVFSDQIIVVFTKESEKVITAISHHQVNMMSRYLTEGIQLFQCRLSVIQIWL